jgi:hypothetical protein
MRKKIVKYVGGETRRIKYSKILQQINNNSIVDIAFNPAKLSGCCTYHLHQHEIL